MFLLTWLKMVWIRQWELMVEEVDSWMKRGDKAVVLLCVSKNYDVLIHYTRLTITFEKFYMVTTLCLICLGTLILSIEPIMSSLTFSPAAEGQVQHYFSSPLQSELLLQSFFDI